MIKLLHSRLARRAKKQELRRYRDDGGDEALRFNYSLDPQSIVLDLGGYKGQWASDLYARYRCKIHVFEPVTGFAKAITERFSHNPDISVHDFGLGASNREIQIAIMADASSSFEKSDNTQPARIVDVLEWLHEQGIERVALAKLNIEGGEYELLERLIEAGKLTIFDHLQIQFHDFTEDAEPRMNQIHAHLAQTHRPEYQYRFVWESWTRKP
jgi:FkbM family methyltransferase